MSAVVAFNRKPYLQLRVYLDGRDDKSILYAVEVVYWDHTWNTCDWYRGVDDAARDIRALSEKHGWEIRPWTGPGLKVPGF